MNYAVRYFEVATGEALGFLARRSTKRVFTKNIADAQAMSRAGAEQACRACAENRPDRRAEVVVSARPKRVASGATAPRHPRSKP